MNDYIFEIIPECITVDTSYSQCIISRGCTMWNTCCFSSSFLGFSTRQLQSYDIGGTKPKQKCLQNSFFSIWCDCLDLGHICYCKIIMLAIYFKNNLGMHYWLKTTQVKKLTGSQETATKTFKMAAFPTSVGLQFQLNLVSCDEVILIVHIPNILSWF